MPNSTTINIGLTYDGGYQSLMEKWRNHFHRKTNNNSGKNFSWFLFLFQATTQLYVTLRYIIPYVFCDYDPWTRYYLKVLAGYFFTMSTANWLCVILYDTSVVYSRDKPFPINNQNTRSKLILQPGQIKARGNTDQEMVPDSNTMVPERNCNGRNDKDVLKWGYCKKCNLNMPPRAHHCNICGKCILKRDHHCYLVGTCVGFKNQRYFVVLTFYSIIVGYWGFYITYAYLRDNMWPDVSAVDIVLPVTIYRTMIGNLQAHHAIMIFHCYMLSLFGPIATVYFFSQVSIIAKGLTLYELFKQVPVRSTSAMSKNFRSVFGDFWAINFIFPAQIILRQPDDGQIWDCVKTVPSVKNGHQHFSWL